MPPAANPWDEHAEAFARWVAGRERGGLAGDAILVRLLEALGDVAGREVLDAGCGEGFLARVLAARGARVTGVDISPRLIALARAKDLEGAIDYRVADLSRPLPELAGRFDLLGSHLALNDVADHRGFAATLATLARPGARAALALNNPYSAVVRGHVADYFANGARGVYGGMSAALGGRGGLLPPHAGGVPGRLPGRRVASGAARGRAGTTWSHLAARDAPLPAIHGPRLREAVAGRRGVPSFPGNAAEAASPAPIRPPRTGTFGS